MLDDLKPYQIMKDSGVSWLAQVPSHWDVLPAFSVYTPRQAKNSGLVESTVLSLSYGRIVVRPPEKLRGLVPESFETYQIVEPGNIIVRTTDLQNDQTSLRVGHAHQRGIITSAYLCLETTPIVLNRYGFQYLNTCDLLKVIYALGSGLRQNLNFSDIKRMPVLVPPKEEQAAIVRFLDYVDQRIRRYIRAKQKLIKLLEEQKQAIIHRAVTRGLDPNVRLKPSGVEWLEEIPEHWEVRSFIRCCIDRADYRGATPTKTDSGVFLVTARNIRKGWIDYQVSQEYISPDDYPQVMRRGLPQIDDLLLTTEAPLGNAALVDREDVAFAQRVIRYRVDPQLFDCRFALHAVLSPYFQHQLLQRATGSTALGIKASKLPQLKIARPPLAEQEKILTFIANECSPLDRGIEKTLQEINLLREFRTRLVADVVTGKLDVRQVATRLPDEPDESEPPDQIENASDAEGEGGEDAAELTEEAEA